MRTASKKRTIGSLAAVAIVAALFALAEVDRSPYAFLNAFHPRRVSVEAAAGPLVASPPEGSRVTLLVFDNADAPRILSEMQGRLGPGRGFHPSRWNSISSFHGFEAQCAFCRGPDPAAPTFAPPDDGAIFISGMSAEAVEDLYEHAPAPPKATPECIVLITEPPSLLDKAACAIRGVLRRP